MCVRENVKNLSFFLVAFILGAAVALAFSTLAPDDEPAAVSRAEIKMIARNVATQVAQDTVLNSNEVKAIASEAAAGKAQEVIESAGLSGDQIDATMKQAIMAFIKSAATESGQAGRDTARPPEQ